MAKVFIYNSQGKVVETKEKGKGRPPSGSKTDENGDLHVYLKEKPVQTMYVTISEKGKVKKEVKSRGRTRHGYTQITDGEYAGHFVKDERSIMTAEVVDEPAETVTSE